MVYRGDLTHGITAVLVCHRLIDAFGSAKYFRAMQWGIPVVSYDWLIESYIAGRVLPMDGFKTDRLQRVILDLPNLHATAPTPTPQSGAQLPAVDEAADCVELRRRTPKIGVVPYHSAEASKHLGFSFQNTQPSASISDAAAEAGEDIETTLSSWKSAQRLRDPIMLHHATHATPTQGVLAESSNRYSAKQLPDLLQGKPVQQTPGPAAEVPYEALQQLHISPEEQPSSEPSTPSEESTCSSGGLTPMSISKPSRMTAATSAAAPVAGQQHSAAAARHAAPQDLSPQQGENFHQVASELHDHIPMCFKCCEHACVTCHLLQACHLLHTGARECRSQ